MGISIVRYWLFAQVQHRLESEGRASPSFWTVALETKKDVGEIYRLIEQALPAGV